MENSDILLNIMEARHSCRSYSGEPVPEKQLEKIVKAGLTAPSGRNLQSAELIVVTDPELMQEISGYRGRKQAEVTAGAYIAVIGDTSRSDLWVEDCTLMMEHMHLMADCLGLGSCWQLAHNRTDPSGRSCSDNVRDILHFPENYQLEAFLAVGIRAEEDSERKHPEAEPRVRVHRNGWNR